MADIVSPQGVAAAPDAGARVVPSGAARVAGAALPSEAEEPAWAGAPSEEVAGPQAAPSALGAASMPVARPQLVSAVAQPAEAQHAVAELLAAQARGVEPEAVAAWPPGRASASRTVQRSAIRAGLPEA